jgi:hypothetical protein
MPVFIAIDATKCGKTLIHKACIATVMVCSKYRVGSRCWSIGYDMTEHDKVDLVSQSCGVAIRCASLIKIVWLTSGTTCHADIVAWGING